MSDAKGMFSELMDVSKNEAKPPVVAPQAVPPLPADHQSPAPLPALPRRSVKETLSDELQNLSEAGYTSHSYRFTESELRWMRRFCLRTADELDTPLSHNTFIRVLFRLADLEWKTDPRDNQLRRLLSSLKD